MALFWGEQRAGGRGRTARGWAQAPGPHAATSHQSSCGNQVRVAAAVLGAPRYLDGWGGAGRPRVAWTLVPALSWATGQSFAGVVVLAPEVPPLAPIPWRVCGAGSTGRAGLLGRAAGVRGLRQGTAGGGHAFGRGGRGLGRGCHGSRLPGGSPKPACSREGAGELRRVLQAD